MSNRKYYRACSNLHHALLMQSYYAVRESEEREAEAATQGYVTEMKEYWAEHGRTTFKDWLVAGKVSP